MLENSTCSERKSIANRWDPDLLTGVLITELPKQIFKSRILLPRICLQTIVTENCNFWSPTTVHRYSFKQIQPSLKSHLAYFEDIFIFRGVILCKRNRRSARGKKSKIKQVLRTGIDPWRVHCRSGARLSEDKHVFRNIPYTGIIFLKQHSYSTLFSLCEKADGQLSHTARLVR